MEKKAVLLVLFVAFFILMYIVSNSPEYSLKKWIPVGSIERIEIDQQSLKKTPTITSSSLQIKLRIAGAEPQNRYWVRLYEVKGSEERALSHSEKWGMGEDELIWDISNYIDRSNPKLEREIFARIGYASSNDSINMQFYEQDWR